MSDAAYPLLTREFITYFTHPDRNLSDKTLLEIGSGESTVFWSSYFREVCSYEHDPEWIEELNRSFTLPDNVLLRQYAPDTIFNDDEFISRVQTSDYIVIDNNPRIIPRGVFSTFVAKNKKEESRIILDNGTWNMDAYIHLIQHFFCRDFPGLNKNNELTVTSLFFSRKTPDYFEYTTVNPGKETG